MKVYNFHTKKHITEEQANYDLKHGLACPEDFVPQFNSHDAPKPLETVYDNPFYYATNPLEDK